VKRLLWFAVALLPVATATAAAVDPGALQAAARYSAQHHGLSFLAIENGRVLLEQYPRGASARSALRIYSGTKAFWGLAALAAAQDDLLNLDELVASTLPEWRNDARKSRVTIRQLLDFSCGLDPKFLLHTVQNGDRDQVALSAQMLAQPGTAFIYGPAPLQVFHRVLSKKLRAESPTHFLERRVLRRLGLGLQRYLTDRAGNPLLASGFVMTAREWAKLGEMVLANGAPVINRNTLKHCWSGSQANRAFAFGWWNNRAAPDGAEVDIERMLARNWQDQDWRAACFCRDAPADLVACIGSLHQRLYVVPSFGLIVVRHGGGGSFSDAAFLRLLFHR
jgi:CubicO group peptidase (beta-lactamase class C family)